MGLLDFFGGGGAERSVKKHAARLLNKRSQAPDRWESIRALGEMKTAEAVEALLGRFTIRVDPSITDQDEKDAAYQAILRAGETAVGPVTDFVATTESIAWGLKILEQLLSSEQMVDLLIGLLEGMDTEYERDPQKKNQVLGELAERRDPRIRPAVERFLEDINETSRFHAVSAVFRQEDATASRPLLHQILVEDESNRIRARILDGYLDAGWEVEDPAAVLRSPLPMGYSLSKTGAVQRA